MGFRKHKKLGKIYDSETKLVIDDMKTKVVLGRLEGEGDEEVFIELDDKAREMAEEAGLKCKEEEQENEEEQEEEEQEEEVKQEVKQEVKPAKEDRSAKEEVKQEVKPKPVVAKKGDELALFTQLKELFEQLKEANEQLKEDLQKSKDECAKMKRTLKSYLDD